MIIGIGTDIIEVERVEKQVSKNKGFREKVFSPSEIEYCESKKEKGQYYAVRFAAKEAFFKALGTGWRNGLAFSEIEIINDDMGKPEVKLKGKTKKFVEKMGNVKIFVSLSHIKYFVNAMVIIEKL